MLKITQQRDAASVSLLLEGRLAGPWVKELEACWRQIAEVHTVVDLTGVTFVDTPGKALLTKMWQQGAELRATGCLTKCLVDEIANTDLSRSSHSGLKTS